MKILPLLFLLSIYSCVEKNPGTSVLTSNIFNQALFSIDGKDASGRTIDLGEHLLTDPPRVIQVQVFNGTNFPYTELDLQFSSTGENSTSTNYLPNLEGAVDFPGMGGTCQKTLAPKKSCTITLEINPREERIFTEIIKLSYKQYVELEEHVATVQFLAGMPASLTFTNDRTVYSFGTPAGPNDTPVVERADAQGHQENIEIKNVGGLSATNVLLSLAETCSSTLTTQCPDGMFGAYRMEHNCPTTLAKNQTCQVSIFYTPLNQNPAFGPIPDDIKEINYRAVVNTLYHTSSSGKQAALNAYFSSVSTDIQARFTTSNSSIIFDQEVIPGNRETRFINIRNVGYRPGYLHKLSIHNQSNTLIADCYKGAGALLNCVDATSTAVPLSQLPFSIKDKNSCLSDEINKVEVKVAQSCNFDVVFQPSVSFITPMLSEFQGLQLYATYDALWKSQETIITTRLSLLNAKSTTAARVIVERISLEGIAIYNHGDGEPSLADLKRITLQVAQYAKAKSLLITFKNEGLTRASNVSLRDGLNRPIVIGGSGVQLGAKNPYYYKSVMASDATCTFIEPGNQCSISLNFAAVGMASNAEEDANMFDTTDPVLGKIKSFILTYRSGANFSDSNRIDAPDYPAQEKRAHLKATLVRKGMLMELADNSSNTPRIGGLDSTGRISINDEVITYLYLRNIGTGDLSYIQALNPPTPNSSSPNYSWSFLPTADPASLNANYDCLDIVDTNLLGTTNSTVDPNLRSGQFSALPSGESCVYTVRVKHSDRYRTKNADQCGSTTTRLQEGARLIFRADDPKDLWEICANQANSNLNNIRFRYFDGDTTGPSATHPDYGTSFVSNNFTLEFVSSWSRKLNFTHIYPLLNATVYRPQFTLPLLATGLPQHASQTIPENWFYGPTTGYYSTEVDPLNPYPYFVKGGHARHPAQALPLFTANKNNYDYIYFVGSFPQSSGLQDLTVRLTNNGTDSLRVVSSNDSSLSGNGLTPFSKTANNSVITRNNHYLVRFKLNTDTIALGQHAHELELTIHSGEHSIPAIYRGSETPINLASLVANKKTRTYKVLFLANILPSTDHPKLSLDLTEFDIVGNEGAPPTLTAKAPINKTLSWYNFPTTSDFTMESIKIPHAPNANDLYDKKVLTITNNSSQMLRGFDYRFRTNIGNYSVATPPSSFNVIPAESSCVVGGSIPAYGSCTLTFKYQPRSSDIDRFYYLSFIYRSSNWEYFNQNIHLSLIPKSPGNLIADRPTQIINYKATAASTPIVRDSYRLTFPNTEMNTFPTEINFSSESGALKKVELTNIEETKTSLLLAYQKHLTQNSLRGFHSGNPAGTSVIPSPGEYATRADGQDYAVIFNNKYNDGSSRLTVEASKTCFFGDDENNAAVAAHEKGFNSSTTTSCYLRLYLRANFDYLNLPITNIDGDIMRDNAFQLWYYSVSRSATESIWLHLNGTILPNSSYVAGTYGDIQALDNKSISLSAPTFTAKNAALGGVSGIRVYLGDNNSLLSNLYLSAPSTYIDIRGADIDGKWKALFSTGLENSKFYYLKAAAIRYDARFNFTNSRFPGLNPGEYISQDLTTPTAKLLVPPLNHFYVHQEKSVIDKSITGSIGNYTWFQSYDACNARTINLRNPDVVNYRYRLMSLNVWEEIKAIPTAHAYANHLKTSHWLSDSLILMDPYVSTSIAYNPSSNSQQLPDVKMFYFRDTANRNAPVRTIAGGVTGTNSSDYWSFVMPTLPWANSRCMIKLE